MKDYHRSIIIILSFVLLYSIVPIMDKMGASMLLRTIGVTIWFWTLVYYCQVSSNRVFGRLFRKAFAKSQK